MTKKNKKNLMILDIIEGIISLVGFGSFLLLSVLVQNELKYVFLIIGVLIGFNLVSMIENVAVYFEKNKKESYKKNIKVIESI